MSAIFGRININKEIVQERDLVPMEIVLNHWNADDSGLWHNHHTGLGHLMLYNTPESLHEKLPYYNPESKLSITADARIDNRDELFARLNIPRVSRKTIPDSSLILKAYEQYAEHCVKYLIGDFAFAIWDENRQQLFCARDHLGVKPFFYYSDTRLFVFASEKKGILTLPVIDKTINKQFFYNQLLSRPEQSTDTTLYQQIKRLPPAHSLIISATGKPLILKQYWTLDTETEIILPSKEAYYEQLLHHFNEAVKCRTRSNFPVGVELSGGMDSSAITGAANHFLKENNKRLFTLSNTLPDGVFDENINKFDERKYIDAVTAYNQIKDPIYITEPAFKDHVEEMDFSIFVNDGMERWNPLWQLPIKKAALQYDIRTLLSGFPGDELVTYRGKYYFLDYRDKNQYLKYFLAKKKDPGLNKLEPLLPYPLKYSLHRLKILFKRYGSAMNEALEIYHIPNKYKRNYRENVWQDVNYKEQFKSYRHTQKYRLLKPQVNQRLESETRYGLHFRTEPRFPMADIRLAQFYLSMPNYLKYDGELARTTYRQAVKQYLPPIIMERDSKFGSVAPFLMLNKYNWNQYIDLLQRTDHPLLKNKDAILEKAKHASEIKKDDQSALHKVKSNNIPSMELLRWLEKNPEWH